MLVHVLSRSRLSSEVKVLSHSSSSHGRKNLDKQWRKTNDFLGKINLTVAKMVGANSGENFLVDRRCWPRP